MSYTVTGNTLGRFTTNAEFQTWGSWISNALANTTMVKVTGVGEINWGSVSAPATAATYPGFEVWRFADGLQTSAPVYFRFDYGSAAGGNTVPSIKWSVGSGANSSGGLTGFLCRDRSLASGNAFTFLEENQQFANSTLVSYFSGDNGRFVLGLNTRGTSSGGLFPMLLSMERTVDYNGAATIDGLLITYRHGTAPIFGHAAWSPIVGTWMHEAVVTDGLCMLTPERGGGTTGANVSIFPIFHTRGGGAFLNPGLNLFGYYHSEITAGSSNTFTVYGASHTYMPLGNTACYGIAPRGNNSITLMMRYE